MIRPKNVRLGALFLVLASCSRLLRTEEPEDPAALRALLANSDPLRREEAAQRMARSGITAPANEDTQRILAELLRALRERSPERMVWRSWHALRVGCLGRPWSEVSDVLGRQGFRFSEMYEPHEAVSYRRFTVAEAAYVDPGGDRHDLFFWVQANRRAETWIVREVYVGLHATFDAPFRMVAGGGRYPAGGVLARFLEMPEVAKLAAVYPVLEELELTYGRIRVKDDETVPAGFHINAGFALPGEGKGGGRGIAVTAEGGLDPRETPSGRWMWEGFAPSEEVGPLVVRGGSFWGAGGLRPSDD